MLIKWKSPMAKRAVPSSQKALPFTIDNVYEAVKSVRLSWRELAGELLVWYDLNSDGRKELDAIDRENISDESRLQAVVAAFLQGEGPYQPSWRMLIHRLHEAGETDVAEKIKTNAEPHQDPTMTVDDVTQIHLPGDKWEKVMGGGGLDIPKPLRAKIQRRYSTDTERNHTCADYYVNCHPEAELKDITAILYFVKEFALSREAKSFISTDPTLTVDNVSHVMEKVEPKVKAQVWVDACYAPMELKKMEELCISGKEDECADLYVNYNPYSSWERLAKSLYRHHQVAAVEEVRSYFPPRDLTITTERLMELFAPMNPEEVDELGDEMHLELPQSEIARIQKDYQSPTQRKEAYLDLYVHQHPCPTWSDVADILRNCVNLRQQADLVENTYVKGTEDTL